MCPYPLDNTDTVTGTASGYCHQVREAVSCDTRKCVYYWECVKSNCQDYSNYIGMTIKSFKERLAEHRDYPKRDIFTEPAGEHFTKQGHTVSHLKGMVLEKVS